MKNIVILISIYLLFSIPLFSQEMPSEWCPKGTWWTYKRQNTGFYRNREHEIYIYKKDTLVDNRTVKKLDIYRCETDMVLYSPTVAFDSFIEEPRYWGYVLMYRQNDSIFGKFSKFSSFVEGRFVDNSKFKFLFKFNTRVGDKIGYSKIVFDSFFCENVGKREYIYYPEIIAIDSLETQKIDTMKYVLGNRDLKLISTKTRGIADSFYGYEYIFENLAPSDYLINAPYNYLFDDSLSKIKDSLYKKHSCGFIESIPKIYYYSNENIKLWCYYQGGQGLYIDRHYGGNGSGCEYVKRTIIDKLSSIKNEKINLIKIVPNPFKNKLVIHGLSLGTYQTNIYDITGSLILSKIVSQYNNTIPMDHLNKGIYFAHIYKDGRLVKVEKLKRQ